MKFRKWIAAYTQLALIKLWNLDKEEEKWRKGKKEGEDLLQSLHRIQLTLDLKSVRLALIESGILELLKGVERLKENEFLALAIKMWKKCSRISE